MGSTPDDQTNEIEEKGKIKPRDLSIVWRKDRRYWNAPVNEDKPAELLQVCWLEVNASADTDPSKNYEVGFCVSLTPDAFGWINNPVFVMAKRGKSNSRSFYKKVILGKQEPNTKFFIPGNDQRLLVEAAPGPHDTGSGDFKTIYFGLYEVWSGLWKGGLKIHYAFAKEVPN